MIDPKKEGCQYRAWFDNNGNFGGHDEPKCMVVKSGQVWRPGISKCICPNGGLTTCPRAQELVKRSIPAPTIGKALGLS